MKLPEIESRLWHIAHACEKVLRLTAGKTLDDYLADDQLPDVVERQLTIVGEAVARIAKIEKEAATAIRPTLPFRHPPSTSGPLPASQHIKSGYGSAAADRRHRRQRE